VLNVFYFVAMGSALVLIYLAITEGAKMVLMLSRWVYGIFL
jgi:hypothetical protein